MRVEYVITIIRYTLNAQKTNIRAVTVIIQYFILRSMALKLYFLRFDKIFLLKMGSGQSSPEYCAMCDEFKKQYKFARKEWTSENKSELEADHANKHKNLKLEVMFIGFMQKKDKDNINYLPGYFNYGFPKVKTPPHLKMEQLAYEKRTGQKVVW